MSNFEIKQAFPIILLNHPIFNLNHKIRGATMQAPVLIQFFSPSNNTPAKTVTSHQETLYIYRFHEYPLLCREHQEKHI